MIRTGGWQAVFNNTVLALVVTAVVAAASLGALSEAAGNPWAMAGLGLFSLAFWFASLLLIKGAFDVFHRTRLTLGDGVLRVDAAFASMKKVELPVAQLTEISPLLSTGKSGAAKRFIGVIAKLRDGRAVIIADTSFPGEADTLVAQLNEKLGLPRPNVRPPV